MKYKVRLTKKALKGLKKAPKNVQELLVLLIDDIEETGLVQKDWNNYSPLGEYTHHCHLNRSWVAVWRGDGEKITIELEEKELVEVEYVGSRESAPY